ncbi:MAG: LysR family transcriptional regulator [Myxococcota bacterium]
MIMDTIPTSEMVALVAVVEEGSFTRAADRMGTRKAQVSRVISRLEARMKARLLHRTTRSLRLTEVGREVYERSRAILAAMRDTVERVREAQRSPKGTLRVSCGVEFGLLAVQPWVRSYLAAFAEVAVEVHFSHRLVDLIHEGFDVAIRVGPLTDSSLSARRLGEVDYGLFASQSYADASGMPSRVEELADHALVLSTQTRGPHGRWTLSRGDERASLDLNPRLLVTSHMAVRDALAAGLGIGLLPCFQARELMLKGRLVPVLPGWGWPPVPVHAVFPSTRYLAPGVRAFVDTCVDGFRTTVLGLTRPPNP